MGRQPFDGRIAELLAAHGPVITLRDADNIGVPRDALRRAAVSNVLSRVGRGSFVLTEQLEAADPWQAHRLRAMGFVFGLADNVYLCGPSAQAVLQIPSVIDPPMLPMARRPGSGHRGPDRTPYGRVRTGFLPELHKWVRDRARVTSAPYTAVDAMRYATADEALVIADHVLRAGSTKSTLTAIARDMQTYPGIDRALWAIRHGDPRAESPLESLGRLAFIEAGRTPPLSNVWITDGRRAYRVDHLLPDSGVVLEGDGALKLNNRPDAHQVIAAQIERERWIRTQGFLVERYDFPVARHRREQILLRADAAERQRAGRPAPNNWSLERPIWLPLPLAG